MDAILKTLYKQVSKYVSLEGNVSILIPISHYLNPGI